MGEPMDVRRRFSDRVEDYVRYRPGYPEEVVTWLREVGGLVPEATVADVGSGTGIWARRLLANGNRVIGVEPNEAMRKAGEAWLAEFGERFESVAGQAEATGLGVGPLDWVTAAQAFHWFDIEACRREWRRILKPGGKAAVLWNERRTDGEGFGRAYERVLRRWSIDYEAVDHRNVTDGIVFDFFQPWAADYAVFENAQRLDWEGAQGRVRSCSYVPREGHANFEPMMKELREGFEELAEDGVVVLDYAVKVFCGRLR